MGEEPYRSAVAFRAGVERGVKAEAQTEPRRTVEQIRRQFLLQRFLVRVFVNPDSPWILKGGTGLIVRMPGARHSNDIDLLYPEQEALLADAVTDLRQLSGRAPDGDFLRFQIAEPTAGTGQDLDHVVAHLKVTSFIGTAEYGGRFPIDLSLNQRVAEPVDRVRPRPVVQLPGSEPLPEFTLYPLSDQVADKLCAMYGGYGRDRDLPSSRYRDLVDLAIIVTCQELDASRTALALRQEAKRRRIRIPQQFTAPGPQWQMGYPRIAAGTILPLDLRTLTGALTILDACLQPLLAGDVVGGRWDPHQRRWI